MSGDQLACRWRLSARTAGSRPRRRDVRVEEEVEAESVRWIGLSFYQRFEHLVILDLDCAHRRGHHCGCVEPGGQGGVRPDSVRQLRSDRARRLSDRVRHDLHRHHAFEFKRSLLVVAERKDTVVQVRAVILIAMLAIVRKLILLDLATTEERRSCSRWRRRRWRLAACIGWCGIRSRRARGQGARPRSCGTCSSSPASRKAQGREMGATAPRPTPTLAGGAKSLDGSIVAPSRGSGDFVREGAGRSWGARL